MTRPTRDWHVIADLLPRHRTADRRALEQGAGLVISSRKAPDLRCRIKADWIVADNSKDADVKQLADETIEGRPPGWYLAVPYDMRDMVRVGGCAEFYSR